MQDVHVQIVINVRNRLNVQNYEICANCLKGVQNVQFAHIKCTYFCTFKRLCAFKKASIPIPRLATFK